METPIEKEISPVQIRLYAVVSPELDYLRGFPTPAPPPSGRPWNKLN